MLSKNLGGQSVVAERLRERERERESEREREREINIVNRERSRIILERYSNGTIMVSSKRWS